jgi:hypothetical protein
VTVVLGLVALLAAASALAWGRSLSRTATMRAARTVQVALYEARMLAVYKGLNHYVVLDPVARTVEIYRDSSSPFGSWDYMDERVTTEAWPARVRMDLPGVAAVLPNPLGGASVTRGWFLPRPTANGPWGSELRGLVALPTGAIASAEETPAVIHSGVIVFSDDAGRATSVGIRGQFGTVHWFRYDGTEWRKG